MKTFKITYINRNLTTMTEVVNARNEKFAINKFNKYLFNIDGEFVSIESL